MAYKIAGIDVHKRMLAVVVADVEVADDWRFERCRFGSTPGQLRALAEWLLTQQVEQVVMESTAQYWKPVWSTLERSWQPVAQQRASAPSAAGTLHLAQAQSNRGRPGRKRDFPDAERLVKRLVANELVLSFVPDATQQLWRTLTRAKYQLTRNRVQLQNRLEALLEQALSRCPASCPLCSVSAPAGCCAPWPRVRPTRRPSPPWRMSACEPRLSNSATPSARARSSIPSS